MRQTILFFTIALAAVLSLGCKSDSSPVTGKPTVVCTTTMLTDLTQTIGGDAVQVRGIMKPGGDPHLYQPTPSDARMIAQSQLVVTSGLHLEGWIDDLVRYAGGTRPVVVASDGVDPIRMEGAPGGVDPHFWFDTSQWKKAAKHVATGLKEVVPKEQHAGIDTRYNVYLERLDRLHDWTQRRMKSIPEEGRVLITSHDAFNYFGRAYGIEVVGIQGASTEQEASQRDVASTVELVRQKGALAVFVESSVNPALIEQVARETGVRVAGPLFSDSVGPEGTEAATYVGMVESNVKQITEALGGRYVTFAELR